MKLEKRMKKFVAAMLAVVMIALSAMTDMTSVPASAQSVVSLITALGAQESACVTWTATDGATGYNVYVKPADAADSAYAKLDAELIRNYGTYWRADALGLAAGNYVLKVEAVMADGVASAVSENVTVTSYDRSGFAFSSDSTYKTGSGAYNEDGTLKSNAQVIYVTPDTAKTVTLDVITSSKGATTACTGVGAILTARQKGYDTTPLAIRFIGKVTDSDMAGQLNSSGYLQVKGKNSYSEMNMTVEGVGSDATAYGWGILLRNCGNVEVRNLGVMLFPDDGISLDTDNCNIWIHNNDIFYGSAGSDADQAKGDGSTDVKGHSTYVTVSYNHYWESGKCSLCGMSDSEEFMVTYHHNWFDHSDSRHPRIRVGSIHVYNNYYDGVSKYGVGVTNGSSAFVENNVFRNARFPLLSSLQGSDIEDGAEGTFSDEAGGIIKAYNNSITGAERLEYANAAAGVQGSTLGADAVSFDAYLASTRDEQVPSSYVTVSGGTSYNNFDTKYDLGVDAADVTPVDQVVADVTANAGRMFGGDFSFTFTEADDTSYAMNAELMAKIRAYESGVVSIGSSASSSGGSGSEGEPTAPSEEATTAAPSVTGDVVHNFTTDGLDSTFFTITGSTSTSKGTVEYNGLTLTKCLKMESKTNISFTTAADAKLVLVFNSANSSNVKVDDIKYTYTENVFEMDLAAGSHTITKADTANLFYMAIVYKSASEDTTTSAEETQPSSEAETTTQAPSEEETQPTAGETETTATEADTTASATEKTDIVLDASDLTAGDITSATVVNGFTLNADSSNKITVDKSEKSIDGFSFTKRIKFGGTGNKEYRNISFTTTGAATVTVYAMSSSSSADRDLVLSNGSSEVGTQKALGSAISKLTYNVTEAGTYYLYSAKSGINVYYVAVEAVKDSGATEPTQPSEEATQPSEEESQPSQEPTQPSEDETTQTPPTEVVLPETKAGDIFVAPNGTGDGSSADSPMDFVTALTKVEAGNTIWMVTGTYSYDTSIIITEDNAGTANAYKSVKAYGGQAVIDFSGMGYTGSDADTSKRGIILDGSYWHFYGLRIKEAADNGMLLSGDNNIIEMCVFEGNHDTGLQLSRYQTDYDEIAEWPSNNLIKNCTSFNNVDIEGENADGFAAKLTCGEGNVFDGCMAYNNSDDGWDLYAKTATGPIGVVTLKNCIAFRNGKLTTGAGSAGGDMNGFKLGGSGVGTPHVVINCIAFENGAHGFTDNNNPTAITLSNCTSFNNSVYASKKSNFQMNRESGGINSNLLSFNTSTIGSDAFIGTISHSVYFNNKPAYYSVVDKTAIAKGDKLGTIVTVAASDFVSLTAPDTSTDFHTAWRAADGSIDTQGFLQVASTSAYATMATDGGSLGARLSNGAATPELPSEEEKPSEDESTQNPSEGETTAPVGGTDLILNVSELTAGDITSSTTVNGFTVNANGSKKVTIDSNNKSIDGFDFTQRLKLSGTGNTEYRNISFTTTGAATLTVYAQSGSGSSDRPLVLVDANGKTVGTQTALGASVSKLTYEIAEAGTYYVYSSDSGINIYYLAVEYADAPSEENPSEEAPSEENPSIEAPSEENPSEEAPSEENPSEEAPSEEAPSEEVPSEENPSEETPSEAPSTDAPSVAPAKPIVSAGNVSAETVINQQLDADNLEGALKNVASGDAVKITVNKSEVSVPAEVFKSAAEKGVGLIFDCGRYAWMFSDLDTAATALNSLNVDINANVPAIEDVLSGTAAANAARRTISFAHDGKLPGTAEVTIDVAEKFANGKELYFYYFNEAAKGFEFVSKNVVADGKVVVSLTHCSDYILSENELPAEVVITAATSVPEVETGDNSPIALYVVLVMLSAVALASYGMYDRKRKGNN